MPGGSVPVRVPQHLNPHLPGPVLQSHSHSLFGKSLLNISNGDNQHLSSNLWLCNSLLRT